MGYYIDPKEGTKEAWLAKYGRPLTGRPEWKSTAKSGELPVCLVDNRSFTAAGVCYSERETMEFARSDGRRKSWFVVPINHLIEVGAIPEGFALEELGP